MDRGEGEPEGSTWTSTTTSTTTTRNSRAIRHVSRPSRGERCRPAPVRLDTGLLLLRYADVRNAFCDDVRFSKSKALRPITFPFMGPNLMGWDGDEHRVKRALVSRAFRRNTIPRYVAPLLRPTAEDLVDDLAPLGEADLMADFAKKYPLRIITRLLGIPRDDEDQMAELGGLDAEHGR